MALNIFCDTYEKHLRDCYAVDPTAYMVDIETLVPRMRAAIARGTANKDSLAFKRTCKELGIKHTYAAIREYTARGIDRHCEVLTEKLV